MGWIRLFIMLPLFLVGMGAGAQTWSEWFSQKKTQQKYLLEQVAALKLYASFLKKGYEVGKSGLGFISDATKGELDLHGAFFSSMKSVSPVVRNNAKVAEVIQMQIDISRTLEPLTNLTGLSTAHRTYASLVRRNLLSDCLADMEELLLLLTAGRLSLSDAERLNRLEALHGRMENKRNFASSFAAASQSLSAEGSRELKTIKKLEEWYENK